MNLITGPSRPVSLNTVERETVFNLETLTSGIFSRPTTAEFPHTYVESDAVYGAPVISKRIVQTPLNGMRMIYVVAFRIDPMAGFNANGIWNHVLPMSADFGF